MRGGQLEMGSADCMALTFRYIFGASESLGLQGLFYISSAALSKALKHGKMLALYALELHPDAKVLWPTFAEQIRNAKLLMRGGPGGRGALVRSAPGRGVRHRWCRRSMSAPR